MLHQVAFAALLLLSGSLSCPTSPSGQLNVPPSQITLPILITVNIPLNYASSSYQLEGKPVTASPMKILPVPSSPRVDTETSKYFARLLVSDVPGLKSQDPPRPDKPLFEPRAIPDPTNVQQPQQSIVQPHPIYVPPLNAVENSGKYETSDLFRLLTAQLADRQLPPIEARGNSRDSIFSWHSPPIVTIPTNSSSVIAKLFSNYERAIKP